MRAFISIELPDELISTLGNTSEKLKKTGIDAKFVDPKNMHFCLKFLGEVDEEALGKARGTMIAASTQFKAFDIELKGVSTFPNTRFIKVIWAGTARGTQEMTGLADLFNAQLDPKDDRAFVPHITLARVRGVGDRAALDKTITGMKDIVFGSFRADKICLMKSELTPSGPKYTELFHVKLS